MAIAGTPTNVRVHEVPPSTPPKVDPASDVNQTPDMRLAQALADILEDALEQLWGAINDARSFDRAEAAERLKELRRRAREAVDTRFPE